MKMKSAEQLKKDFKVLTDSIFSVQAPEEEKKDLLADMVASQFINGWYCGYEEAKNSQ